MYFIWKMIKHRLFGKGQVVYSLLISYSHPNLLVPVKCIIRDVKFDEINPEYKVDILKFYDSPDFLRLNFSKMSYVQTFNERPRRLRFREENPLVTHEDFFRDMHERPHRFTFVVDSVMTFVQRAEMMSVFNKIEDHFIEKCLRDLKYHITRTHYVGRYKIPTYSEFFIRLRKFIGDKIAVTDRNWIDYIDRL